MIRIIILSVFLVIISCSHDNSQIVDGEDNVVITLQFPEDPLVEEIGSYRLIVNAVDLAPPTEESSNITPTSGLSDNISAYIPEGDERTITFYFSDGANSVIFWGQSQTNVSDDDSITISIYQAAASTATRVVVLRDNLPWNSEALDEVLTNIGLSLGSGDDQYLVISSSVLDTVSLESGIDLVIVANDQGQEFYDNYSASQPKIESFISNGGTILWEACDLGWARGSIDSSGLELPGGVRMVSGYESTNYITSSLYSITSGMDSVLSGNYASHEGFIDLPEGALVYSRDTRGLPTLASFRSGKGWVIISGQPLEYDYQAGNASTPGAFLPRIISHVLGY